MPRFDFKCPACGHVDTDVIVPLDRLETPRGCVRCDSKMERQPAAPSFYVRGYSARNGYSK